MFYFSHVKVMQMILQVSIYNISLPIHNIPFW